MMRPYGWRFNIYWNGAGGGDGGDGTGGDGTGGNSGGAGGPGDASGGGGNSAGVGGPGDASGGGGNSAGPGGPGDASGGGGNSAGVGGPGDPGGGAGNSAGPGGPGDPGGGQGAPAGQGGIGSDVGAVAHGADPFGGLVGVSQNPSSLSSLATALANSIYGHMPAPPGTLGSPFGFTADPVSALDHAVNQALQGMNPFGTSLSPGVPGQTMGYPSQTPSIGVLGQPQATPAPAPGAVDPGLYGGPTATGLRGIGSDAVAGKTAGQSEFGPPGPGFGPTGQESAPPGVNPGSIAAAQNPFGGLTGNLGFGNTRGVGDPGAPGSSAVGTAPANQAPGTIGPEATPSDVGTTTPAPTVAQAPASQTPAPPAQPAQATDGLMNALISALQGNPALAALAAALLGLSHPA